MWLSDRPTNICSEGSAFPGDLFRPLRWAVCTWACLGVLRPVPLTHARPPGHHTTALKQISTLSRVDLLTSLLRIAWAVSGALRFY